MYKKYEDDTYKLVFLLEERKMREQKFCYLEFIYLLI